ncbi:hypothetical protein MB27_27985 [Actinoplanes utahensis]|uniref:Uncharacterized protein n=1 Tax=Actinoplanes utahensis TaxID=1869 RepID=A0A0A6X366_ACTUT|nr:hypothetical protein MB27_27985 [Actinoplanes utahensis]
MTVSPKFTDCYACEALLDFVDERVDDFVVLVRLPQDGVEILLDVLRDDPFISLVRFHLLPDYVCVSLGYYADCLYCPLHHLHCRGEVNRAIFCWINIVGFSLVFVN